MDLFKLPTELILMIGEWADAPTVSALATTCGRLHELLNPLLYRRNAKEQHSDALVWAAENGRVDTARLCLAHGADINTASSLHEETEVRDFPASGTPLHYAVLHANDDLVQYLLDNGADHQRWCTHLCECKPPRLQTAIVHPSRRRAVLTSHWSPLHLALCKGHTSTAKILIDWNVSCEMTLQVSWNLGPRANELRPSTFNVVHEIALHKNLEVLEHMIGTHYPLGTLSNAVTFNGNTPLHLLTIQHSYRSFMILGELLMHVGPNINVMNNDLLRPIDCFVKEGGVEGALILFELGSRPLQIFRCILSAVRIRIQPGRSAHERMERRNELVLGILNYALDTGCLTRECEENGPGAGVWYFVFLNACKQPALLQRLLDEGFRPSSLSMGQMLLLWLIESLSRHKCLACDLAGPFFESIRLLTRSGERWDTRKDHDFMTPLEYLVKDCGSMAAEVRASLFGCLLDTRPPEETGEEQAHFDELCQYALDHGDTQTYENLVSYAARGSRFYRRSGSGVNAEISATGAPRV